MRWLLVATTALLWMRGVANDLESAVEQRLTIAAAVWSLSERDRELGMRSNGLEVALHRALSRLRSLLGDTTCKETARRAVQAVETGSPCGWRHDRQGEL